MFSLPASPMRLGLRLRMMTYSSSSRSGRNTAKHSRLKPSLRVTQRRLVVCAVDTLLPGQAAGGGQNAGVQLARRQTCKTEADVGLEDFEARAERLIDDMYGCEDAQRTGYSGLAEVDSQTCELEETGVSGMAGNDGCENQLALMPENPDNLGVSQQAVAEAEPSCVAALMPAAEVGQQDSFLDTYVEVEPISATEPSKPASLVPPVSQPGESVVFGSKPRQVLRWP